MTSSVQPGTLVTVHDKGRYTYVTICALYVTEFISPLCYVVMEEDVRFLSANACRYETDRTRLEETEYVFDKEADVWMQREIRWTC